MKTIDIACRIGWLTNALNRAMAEGAGIGFKLRNFCILKFSRGQPDPWLQAILLRGHKK